MSGRVSSGAPEAEPRQEVSLADLRAKIDDIDAAMHGLLLERAGVVAQIEGAKKVVAGRSAFRPAREADMMRRLVARHRGAFSLASTEHIWREIIAGFTRLQAPFAVHVAGRSMELRDLARFQFGVSTPLTIYDNVQAALSQLDTRPSDLVLLPSGEECSGVWWDQLGRENGLYVLARAPFILGALPLPKAYIVARLPPEASGDDRTLFAITGNVDETALEIAALVPDAKPIAERIVGGRHHVLAQASGFLIDTDYDARVRVIGAYSVPLYVD